MPTKAFSLESLPDELKQIGHSISAAVLKGLRLAAYDLHGEAVRQVDLAVPRPPVNFGQLKGGFRVDLRPDGATVENIAPHAAHMEWGTRPHWAPISALRKWARQKLRGRGTVAKGFKGPVRKMLTQHREDEIESLAKRAQRSIAKRGTAPRHFWAKAVAKASGFVEDRVVQCLREVK